MSGADRYSRSILFPGIGEEGQRRIARFSIAFVGVGAVGAAAAEVAVRAGIRPAHAHRPRRRRGIEPRPPVPLRRRGRGARRAQGRGGGARAWREIDPAAHVAAVVADLERATRGSSSPATTSSSTGRTTSKRGSSSRTRRGRSGSRRSTPPAWRAGACVAVSVPGRTPCLRCYLEALPPGGLRDRRATPRASCRRCRRWWRRSR